MRFHLLGLAHVPTRKEISVCAFTQKIRRLSMMAVNAGHTVFFYGTEGSDIPCSEFIQVGTASEREDSYGKHVWQTQQFVFDSQNEAYQKFNARALVEILAREEPGDFLLCPMGHYNASVADGCKSMTVESGIGYSAVFAKRKVFESMAWRYHVYGLMTAWKMQLTPHLDTVIPNYFDPDEFPYCEKKEDYYLFMGRMNIDKGVATAVITAKALGVKLKVAGQPGARMFWSNTDDVEYLGAVGPEQRAELMSKARAFFAPTQYIEPFGGVAVEAQMCGTPVLASNWGAFPETVKHARTGFLCNTIQDFVNMAPYADRINPAACRKWAMDNFSMEAVWPKYERYFESLTKE